MMRGSGYTLSGWRHRFGMDAIRRKTRRKVLMVVGLFAIGMPMDSCAQAKDRLWRVGFLSQTARPDLESHYYGAFPRGMRELGYVEGKNLTIEWRFADGKAERLPALAAELVRLKVDAIVAANTPATAAAQTSTATIPIVMASVGDPVGSGFVKSLAHPQGNITGLSTISDDLTPKLLEILQSIVPRFRRLAVLVNSDNSSTAAALNNATAAARKAGVTILSYDARNPQQIEAAFSQMARQKAGALIVTRDPLFNRQVRQIATLAAGNRLPAVAGLREYVEAGGLISYGNILADNFQRVAIYVDKIFKGAKPAGLPVEQPTKFELVLNLKAAKALGVRIPQSILVRADRVIE